MKKLIPIIVVVVVVILGIVFVPRLAHKCDECEEFFIGTGYEPNKLNEVFSDEEMILCKECAEVHHSLSLFAGKDLDEFKRDLF